MNTQQTNAQAASSQYEKDFCNSIMPRAQLSAMASKLAVDKASQKNAKEFAGFELLEAETVVKLLQDLGTEAAPVKADAMAFIAKLKAATGNEFDRLYMEAELSNHEYLRDLATNYLAAARSRNDPAEKETRHIAMLAEYAFIEHVGLCKRIYGEVSA